MSDIRTVSVKRACELYGIGRTKIYVLLAAGEITAIKFGRKTLVEAASIDSWLERQPRYLRCNDNTAANKKFSSP